MRLLSRVLSRGGSSTATRRLRTLGIAALLAVFSLSPGAHAGPVQGPSPQPAAEAGNHQPIPDHVLYRFFFAHLESLDRIAAQQEAAGKDGEGWRSHEQRAAGLSAEEGAVVKRVAAECNRAVRGQQAKLRAAIAAAKSQAGSGERNPPPEVHALAKAEEEIVEQHIGQLRSQLGEAGFQKLDGYLKTSVKVHIKTQASPTARAQRGGQ